MTRTIQAVVMCCLVAAVAGAAGPARTMYAAAQAHEAAIRAAWSGDARAGATAPTLRQVRAAIGEYEGIVREHPTNGYADNALWQAAHLSLDAYSRFNDEYDRQRARQFFHWLANEYPGSPFVAVARAEEQRLQSGAALVAAASRRPPTADPAARKLPAAQPAGRSATAVIGAADLRRPIRARLLGRPVAWLPVTVPPVNIHAWLSAGPVDRPVQPAIAPEALAPGVERSAEPVPTADRRGGFSMARQLGLGVSRIVIDPGHGGHDPGAAGGGASEAAVVLDIALRLETLLKKVPGIAVVLTRRTDDYVSLQDRTAIANREQADLFISIHANASRDTRAHGIETYFLDFAPTPADAAIAARENAVFGKAMSTLPEIVRSIALNNKADESRELASTIEASLARRLKTVNRGLTDHGVKRAPFVVLIGAVMPSVLVEISFITNPREAQLLRQDAYRQRVAEALLDGVQRYQTALRNARAISYWP
jgi:N-acetylmuramoyl-L-alanine amidase